MKKIYCILFSVLFVLLLTACESNSEITPITEKLSFVAEISYDENEIICNGEIDEKGTAKFTVVSPEEIDGFFYKFEGEKTQTGFGDINYLLGDISASNPFGMLNSFFTTVRKDKSNISLKNNVFSYFGKCDCGKFRMDFGESGMPIGAVSESENIEVVFKKVYIAK